MLDEAYLRKLDLLKIRVIRFVKYFRFIGERELKGNKIKKYFGNIKFLEGGIL